MVEGVFDVFLVKVVVFVVLLKKVVVVCGDDCFGMKKVEFVGWDGWCGDCLEGCCDGVFGWFDVWGGCDGGVLFWE